MFHAKKNDLSARLLLLLDKRIPGALRPWSQAMLAELVVIDGFGARLRWSLGGAMALVRAWVRQHSKDHVEDALRLQVGLVAAYHFLFSATLIGVITWQLPRITEPWTSAVPALILCYGFTLLPAILGLGLALRDEAARIATIVFSIAHSLLNAEYLRRGYSPHPRLTTVHFAADLLIVLVLTSRPVQRHFKLSPLALHLSDESPDFDGQ